MAGAGAGCFWLLELPNPCLLAVLQCLADQHSVLSAARAHSRLHQAAVLALRSITAVATRQEHADSVLLYLSKYGQHVDSFSIEYTGDVSISLRLPSEFATQLRSWQSKKILLAGDGLQGLLGPTLTQLRLERCGLCGDAAVEALATALPQLPSLQHLSIRGLFTIGPYYQFSMGVLQQLQQLTYLELDDLAVLRPDEASLPLQPLQALTGLMHLRLEHRKLYADSLRITASMLSGAHLLTCLQFYFDVEVEPAVLAGKTRLQHLQIAYCKIGAARDAAHAAQLLSQVQQLQQLTHLDLGGTLDDAVEVDDPPAAAYAALTASSRLQHLNIRAALGALPEGVWQHMFPAGRQLPHLRELNITAPVEPAGECGTASLGTRLVSCCIGLQSLDMQGVPFSAELMAALQGLSGLHTLRLEHAEPALQEGLEGVCQLTGLRELSVQLLWDTEDALRLTQLKQLTALKYYTNDEAIILTSRAPGDEPVWRQLLRLHLDSSDPDVAQQAAAALAE